MSPVPWGIKLTRSPTTGRLTEPFVNFTQTPPFSFRLAEPKVQTRTRPTPGDHTIPRQYLFQGTGYPEFSNAAYRAYLLSKKVRFSDIPNQMRLMTRKRAQDRREAQLRSMTPQSPKFRSIRDFVLPLSPNIPDALISENTSYSLKKFMKISIERSRNYALRRAYVTYLEAAHGSEVH
ncbi:hypothetical protein BWQ96_09229 [Gracilariopsis chorda]|uniref:Uncharacterized protein n=1 Tax=Gracilariopsis chorda TaxID=448386 RepID=A0A2V3IIV3_9FLOR|nr:hypothetical protein BWQ96_09229 [Gracilariopsis chorda]|eukprot:PXF41050.1 hypothetical protein BWQ96_09229 [Gracilariopsis chorda]